MVEDTSGSSRAASSSRRCPSGRLYEDRHGALSAHAQRRVLPRRSGLRVRVEGALHSSDAARSDARCPTLRADGARRRSSSRGMETPTLGARLAERPSERRRRRATRTRGFPVGAHPSGSRRRTTKRARSRARKRAGSDEPTVGRRVKSRAPRRAGSGGLRGCEGAQAVLTDPSIVRDVEQAGSRHLTGITGRVSDESTARAWTSAPLTRRVVWQDRRLGHAAHRSARARR